MKNLKSRIWAGASALALVAVAAFGAAAIAAPAQAAPDGPAAYLFLDRAGAPTAATASSGSYTNMTDNTAKWASPVYGGFIPGGASVIGFSNGAIDFQLDGVYTLSWNAILSSGGSGLCGFAINGDTPNGGILYGIGPIVNLAAATGGGTVTLPLQQGDYVNLWCYGSGGSITLQGVKATNISVALIDEL